MKLLLSVFACYFLVCCMRHNQGLMMFIFSVRACLNSEKSAVCRGSKIFESNAVKGMECLKKAKMPVSNGYLVVAVRSDGAVAAWLDMQPALHEYYENEVIQAVMKVPPFYVEEGIVVFGIKMAIDTAKHTVKNKPNPAAWNDYRKGLSNPADIEQLVLAAWPE